MSLRALVGSIALAVGLAPVLTGCGSDNGDADDVPTITTRPSTPVSSTPTMSDPPTSSATSSPSTSVPTPTETTAPASSEPPTEPPTETGPSPEPPTDQPVGPTTYRQALERIDEVADTSAAPTASTRFSTSGDVVYCLLDDPVIGPACELRTGFIKDDEVCGGAAEGVGRIETFDDVARPACNTDTIREPGAREIQAPGIVRLTGGGVTCAVERAGVTCVATDARTGFFLGPGEYHVF